MNNDELKDGGGGLGAQEAGTSLKRLTIQKSALYPSLSFSYQVRCVVELFHPRIALPQPRDIMIFCFIGSCRAHCSFPCPVDVCGIPQVWAGGLRIIAQEE